MANDDESSKLLIFNSPNGRYRFLRIPASDVCQNRIFQILENIEGATNSQGDIIIWGENLKELKIEQLMFSNLLETRA